MSARFCRLLGIGLTCVMVCHADPRSAEEPPALPFIPGETLTYDVTWSIFPAGQVVATLRQVGEDLAGGYEVITTARSQGFVSLLFKVEDEFRSFFDPQTLCSQRILKRIREGHRHRDTQIVFDSLRRLAILDERDPANDATPPKHAENAIPGCVADVVTGFYVVRRQPLRVGNQIHVPVNDGAKTYDVTLEIQAREQIQTPLGIRAAFRVEPKVFGSLYKRKGRMLIWFSDDEQRLPLRIKASLAAGTLTGNLKSVTTSAMNSAPGQ